MSQKTTQETDDALDTERFKTTHGIETRDLDVTDEHELDDVFEDDSIEREIPVEVGAQRFVERYDERAKAIREYLANAHTACIQRAAVELREVGVPDDEVAELLENDVRGLLERAQDEADYDPVIEVDYNRDPSEGYTLRIADNGIGISKSRFVTIKDIGLSGWHMEGSVNGQFGQGTMSGFLLTSIYGEFEMNTRSRRTDESYRVSWGLTDMTKLPGGRDSYGTTFEFPVFCDEAQDIDVPSKVEEYAEGMIVPVIYRDYDEDGRETGRSDDFTPSYLEDLYDDESPLVTYEDEFVKAVWSPDDSNSRNHTWCGYQPIDRNDPGYSLRSYEMTNSWDMRIKVEDGPVYAVPDGEDDSVVGKIPVGSQKYRNLPDDQKDKYVERSEVPSGAIIVPAPTDDRDRLQSKHVDDFCREVSRRLDDELRKFTAELLEDVDDFGDVLDLALTQTGLLLRGISRYGPSYSRNDPDEMQEHFEDELGVTIPTDVCKQIDVMKQKVSWAPPSSSNPQRKGGRREKAVWRIEAGTGDTGDVFMASRVNESKSRLAWELDDSNQVVQVKAGKYQKWADLFGWRRLKELPNRNFEEEFPDHDFDDAFLDTWDRSRASSSGSGSSLHTGSGSFDDERAKSREVKVRRGTGSPRKISKHTGEDLFEALENGQSFKAGTSYGYNKLVLYDQTDGHGTSAGIKWASKSLGTAYAVVPSYVYDYLIRAENAYTEDELVQEIKNTPVEHDWHFAGRDQTPICDLDERDVILYVGDTRIESIQTYGLEEELREEIADEIGVDAVDSVTYTTDLDQWKPALSKKAKVDVGGGPSIVSTTKRSPGWAYRTDAEINEAQLVYDEFLPGIDRSAPEARAFSMNVDDPSQIATLKRISDAGGFVSQDDDADVPDTDSGVWNMTSRVGRRDVVTAKTLERLDDAGGYVDDPSEVLDL